MTFLVFCHCVNLYQITKLTTMSFAQTLKIENKIFTKVDIQHFWNKISSEGETTLILEFENGAKYSSKNDNSLKDGELIDQKKCKEITISYSIGYWDHCENKRINFNLSTDQYYSYNRLEVEAEDEHWALATFTNLSDKINSLPKHPKWIRNSLSLYFICACTSIISNFLLFIVNLQILISYYIIFIISLFLILILIFPNIEFDFGPEDKKFAKKWRNRLRFWLQFIFGVVILGIIIGLATNFIYDKIK